MNRPYLPILVFVATSALPGAAESQMTRVRISGDGYVDFADGDKNPERYSNNGAMCVIHKPGCDTGTYGGFSVGHNGKDHYFPKDHPLPPGATLVNVEYQIFWPAGLTKTDRGDVGSKGSYGTSPIFNTDKVPPFSMHWENTCQTTYSANWSNLPIAYQVSFIVDVPTGTALAGNASDGEAKPGQVCRPQNRPGTNGQVLGDSSAAPSGFDGSLIACVRNVRQAANLLLTAHLVKATNPDATGYKAMDTSKKGETVSTVTFYPGGVSGSTAGFRTRNLYVQGVWQIDMVKLVGITGKATNVPATVQLPGALRSPVINWTGGPCPS